MEIVQGAIAAASPPVWVGILPFLVLIAIVLFTKRGLVAAALSFLFVTAALTLLVWQVYPAVMAGSLLKGLLTALDIVIIIAGALFFLDVLKKTRVLSSLEHYLHKLAPDSRIQALILAWFLGALIEGSAGFGAPAAVVAPLLVHLGFAPVTSATLALLANTAPVAFGAAGTPIKVGLGFADPTQLVPWVAGVSALLALLAPILLSQLLRREVSQRAGIIGPHGFSHKVGDTGKGRPSSTLPFAVWCGAAFALPFFLASRLGPEFPSIFGAAAGMLLTVVAAQIPAWRRVFIPRITQRLKEHDPNLSPLHIWRVILPYLLLIVGLIAGRTWLPSFGFGLPGGLSHNFNLFNPGFIMLAIAAALAFHGGLTRIEVHNSAAHISQRLVKVSIVVGAVVAASQLLVGSGLNHTGSPSMLMALQQLITRENLLVLSPFIGALGGFLAGSTTVSNLIFGELQWQAAVALGTSGMLVLTLQVIGATIGNSVALTNISAVEAALGSHGLLRPILAKLFRYLFVYAGGLILFGTVASIALHLAGVI